MIQGHVYVQESFVNMNVVFFVPLIDFAVFTDSDKNHKTFVKFS